MVLGILGFTGWYVYHVKQASDKNYSTSASLTVPTYKKKSTTKASAASADPYAGWASYTSKLEGIAIKYPSDWTAPSDGSMLSILNNTAQEEMFSTESSAEKLSTGKLVRANVRLDVATSGLSAGDCHGLVVHFIKPITVSGRSMSIVTLDSYTEPGSILGIYVTDEQGLYIGGTTSICQPSFASVKGNSNVFVSATFTRPPQPGDHSDGASIQLTEAEYNESSIVRKELKSLESLSY